MRTLRERREVNKLIARGASDYAIAGITGIPRGTIQRWRTKPLRGPQAERRWRPPDGASYAYLLGLYLGDGCLSQGGTVLMVALGAQYPGIVDSAAQGVPPTRTGAQT